MKKRISLPLIQPIPKPQETNLQVVRLSTSAWSDDRGVYLRKSLTTLKRKSSGYQILTEDVNNISPLEVIENIVNLNDCVDGIYKVEICNVSTDWETGYVESYDYKLVPF